jgi:large subunit ribosomal protein L25
MPAVIEAKKRDLVGKKSAKNYRNEGYIPGVYYFHGNEAVSLLFDAKKLTQLLMGHRGLIDLKIEDEKEPLKCFLKDFQQDPVTDTPIHVDFQGVKMGEKIIIEVPLVVKGTPVGVKAGGIMEHITRDLEIECLPKDLPEILEVDVSQLEIGDSIHINDLNYENIRILNDPDDTVILVEAPRIVVEEEVVEEELTEPELIGEEKEGEEEEEGREDREAKEQKAEKEDKEERE